MADAPRELVIGADDRTGALETAGALADAIGQPVTVVTAAADIDRAPARGVVVDLGTRHLTNAEAGARAAELDAVSAVRQLHKTDSLLRGNWAHELATRQRRPDRAVLLVPALPALGRTCEDGVVKHAGVPVHEGAAERDALDELRTSRPAEMLADAGVADIIELHDDDALRVWLGSARGVAVCDAATDTDVQRIARRWREHPGVLLAGTSAVMAAGASGGAPPRTPRTTPTFEARRVLVVSGSLHAAARRQVEQLVAAGAHRFGAASPDHGVVVVESADADTPVDPARAVRVAADLGATASALTASWSPDAVVVIGGDTAASVLGDGPVAVLGTLAAGAPWMRVDGTVFATRSGAFGDEDALVELVWGTLSA